MLLRQLHQLIFLQNATRQVLAILLVTSRQPLLQGLSLLLKRQV